jgi:hypothetical protein
MEPVPHVETKAPDAAGINFGIRCARRWTFVSTALALYRCCPGTSMCTVRNAAHRRVQGRVPQVRYFPFVAGACSAAARTVSTILVVH